MIKKFYDIIVPAGSGNSKEAKWNEETQSGTYSDKIHHGEMKRGWQDSPVLNPQKEGIKALLVERFACNGGHSHYDLINRETGETLFTPSDDNAPGSVEIPKIKRIELTDGQGIDLKYEVKHYAISASLSLQDGTLKIIIKK